MNFHPTKRVTDWQRVNSIAKQFSRFELIKFEASRIEKELP